MVLVTALQEAIVRDFTSTYKEMVYCFFRKHRLKKLKRLMVAPQTNSKWKFPACLIWLLNNSVQWDWGKKYFLYLHFLNLFHLRISGNFKSSNKSHSIFLGLVCDTKFTLLRFFWGEGVRDTGSSGPRCLAHPRRLLAGGRREFKKRNKSQIPHFSLQHN